MSTSFTEPVEWLQKPFEGYVLNAVFSDDNSRIITTLTQEIEREYGKKVFVMPKNSLHITLMDWVAPLVDYGEPDKEELFNSIRTEYDDALSKILSTMPPITVRFTEIKVYPTTIILQGHDDGQFQVIRNRFLDAVRLLPNTKKPPTIIHSSIARFKSAMPLETVETLIASKRIDIVQEVDAFRLVHTSQEPMLQFEILKEYLLGS